MSTKLTPADVAARLHISTQAVRVGLKKGVLPFGWAIETSPGRTTYAISEKLFREYLGEVERDE